MSITPDLDAAADFIWRTARLIDRKRFAYHFSGGSAADVVQALRPYQNADGGFGEALEPDMRGPTSQPQHVEVALRILDEVDAFDATIIERACDFLACITTPEGGVPFVLPTVRPYPRAFWWETDDNASASLNPTAAIAGLLHKRGVEHPWLSGATAYCWSRIEAQVEADPHSLLCVFTFLQHVPDRNRAQVAFKRTGNVLMTNGVVALDPATPGYVKSPLDFAPLAGSPVRCLFGDRVIEAHLDALALRQREDGGWPITWDPPSALAALEWRGFVTVGALLTLRSYGRL